jgi:hypothetical protein
MESVQFCSAALRNHAKVTDRVHRAETELRSEAGQGVPQNDAEALKVISAKLLDDLAGRQGRSS